MEFIQEASEYIHGKEYLTPHEKSIILARLQLKEFSNFEQCQQWINNTIQDLLTSDDPKQELKTSRERNV